MEFLQLPTAQRRCGRTKKYVYVGDDFVYKGPYKEADTCLAAARRVPHLIESLQNAMDVPENLRTSLPIAFEIRDADGNVYVAYPNVGAPPRIEDVRDVSTKIDTDIPVLERKSFVMRVSEIENEDLDGGLIKCVLQHLYTIFLLDIGDFGTHNMLLCKRGTRLLAGIDVEERRSAPRKDDIFSRLFKTGSSKIQRTLYGPHLRAITLLDTSKVSKNHFLEMGGDFERLRENAEAFRTLLHEFLVTRDETPQVMI